MAESVFLDYASRGRIKLIPDDKSKAVTLRAEDVTVELKLPLGTSSGLDGTDYSVDTASSSSTDSSGNTTTESTEPTLVMKFKLTITPKDMTRQAFKEKRANYLFDFEQNTFTAVSDMFRKATTMQFTDIQYVIPAGEESAFYQIEMTQVYNDSESSTNTTSTNGVDVSNISTNMGYQELLKLTQSDISAQTTPKSTNSTKT